VKHGKSSLSDHQKPKMYMSGSLYRPSCRPKPQFIVHPLRRHRVIGPAEESARQVRRLSRQLVRGSQGLRVVCLSSRAHISDHSDRRGYLDSPNRLNIENT